MSHNALDVLSKVSGLDRKEADSIWESVKANHKLLDNCERPHDFEPIEGRPMPRFRCSKCGGVVTSPMATYYKQGLRDAV